MMIEIKVYKHLKDFGVYLHPFSPFLDSLQTIFNRFISFEHFFHALIFNIEI